MRDVVRVFGLLFNPVIFTCSAETRDKVVLDLGCFACLGSYISPLNRCKSIRGTASFSLFEIGDW